MDSCASAIWTCGQISQYSGHFLGSSGSRGVETLRRAVLDARAHGGGWVQIVWHRICPHDCGRHSWRPGALDAFLTWLETERAVGGVEVRTSQEVLGGAFHPAVEPPEPPAAPRGPNRLRNPSLERRARGAVTPTCWERRGTGGLNRVNGPQGQAVTITGAPGGFVALAVPHDQGECAAAVDAGERLVARAVYRSKDRPRIVAWARSKAGGWAFWRESRRLAPTRGFRRASFRLPPVPAGVTALSVGVALSGDGRAAVDDLGLARDVRRRGRENLVDQGRKTRERRAGEGYRIEARRAARHAETTGREP